MSSLQLAGKRILITQSDTFMGPTLCEVFKEMGAEVIKDNHLLTDPALPAQIVEQAGYIDVLVINLAIPAPFTRGELVDDSEWSATFSAIVDPLPRLCRAVLPQMIQRQSGKILVMGSASALRGMKRASTYSAARCAQLAYVQAMGGGNGGAGYSDQRYRSKLCRQSNLFPRGDKSQSRLSSANTARSSAWPTRLVA